MKWLFLILFVLETARWLVYAHEGDYRKTATLCAVHAVYNAIFIAWFYWGSGLFG